MSTNPWARGMLVCLRLAAIVGIAVVFGLIHFVITQLFTLYLIYSALLGLPLGYLIAMFGPECANRRQFSRLLCFTFACAVVVLFVSNMAYFQQFSADISTRAPSERLGLPGNVFEFIVFRLQHESSTLVSINMSSLSGLFETAAGVAQAGIDTSGSSFVNALLMGLELLLLWLFVSLPCSVKVTVGLKTGVSYDTVLFVRDLLKSGRSELQIREQLRARGITTDAEITRAIQSVRIYAALKARRPNSILKDLLWR